MENYKTIPKNEINLHTVTCYDPLTYLVENVICVHILFFFFFFLTHSCLILCHPMDYTVHRIPQARILE